MKIFLDEFCFNTVVTADQQSEIYKKYQHVDQLPDDCNLIAITFNNNYYSSHTDVIRQLLDKTRQLIVVVIEPTEQQAGDFRRFVQAHDDPKICIFSPAIANFSTTNLQPMMFWWGLNATYYGTELWGKTLRSRLQVGCDRPKRFDCLLGTEKQHRTQIEQMYKSSACQDQLVYSYFKNQINQGIWSFNVDKFKITANRVRVDIHGRSAGLGDILPVDIYNETFYSIVAETICTNQHSHFTEKTGKPIIAGRPFVVFSGQYFLRNLRSLGFQTFGSVIDESYDDIADESERLARAWHEVERLCRLDPATVMQQLQSVLSHNQQHFLSTDWYKPLAQVIQSIALD